MSQFGNGWSNPPGYPPSKQPASGQVGQPPASQQTGTWYAYCNITRGTFSVLPGLLNTAGFSDAIVVSGPFNTRDEAAAAGQAGCSSGATSKPPTVPTTPTGPTPTGPTQPTGGKGPAGIGWWAVCLPGNQMVVVPGTSANSALTVAGGEGSVVGGPWPDQETANQQIAAQGLKCGVKEECSIQSILPCPTIPPMLAGIGVPGTAEWCDAIKVAVAEIGTIGSGLFKFIDDMLNYRVHIENMDSYIANNLTSPVSVGVVKVIREVFCWLAPFAETVRSTLQCFQQWMQALFPKCDNSATWGLILIRSFLSTLQRIEWGSDAAVWLVARSGIEIDPLFNLVNYLIAYACPAELPSEEATIEAYKYNIIDDKLASCILQSHGLQWQTALPGIIARGDKPGWKEAIQFVRRGGGNTDDEAATLRNLGVLDKSYQQVLQTIYNELPTISDHLEWLRKNAFDSSYITTYRLLDGFGTPQDLAAAGFPNYVDQSGTLPANTFWQRFGADLTAQGMQVQYAALHYAAHWINPSFGQQFAMVQRLREGRVPANLVFSRADLLRTMQEMDVGPSFRERLEAVSHPLPNLTLCLKMFRYGVIDATEFVEKLKDLGYSAEDASTIGQAQLFETRRLNASAAAGWTPRALAKAYAVGQITAEMVSNEIKYLGFTQDDADRLMRRAEIEFATEPVRWFQRRSLQKALNTQEAAYQCGAIDGNSLLQVYQNAGMPAKIGAIAVQNVDAGMSVALCKAQVKAFKTAVTSGKITLDTAALMLQQVGVPPQRAQQYLQSWALEVKVRAPQASAAKILRWVGLGLLDRETAASRLSNLGWTDPDLTLSLAESLAKLSALQNRIQASAARSQQSAARAALRAAQQAESTAQKLRSQLRGIASRSTLQKWYKDGLIDDAYFIDAMTLRGYDEDSTLKYLEEAQLARAKAVKPPAAKATKGAQSNGTAQGRH